MDSDNDVSVLSGPEVASLLSGREIEIIDLVRTIYSLHGSVHSSAPESSFLTFPDKATNRIIAKPGYVGAEFDVAGVKWVSSFPDNASLGLERSSAVVLLNSTSTGRLTAIVAGTRINFKRTAASAVLAAQYLGDQYSATIGLIGCGSINFEIVRFLLVAFPDARRFDIYDRDENRARHFRLRCQAAHRDLDMCVSNSIEQLLEKNTLISIATTATQPHIDTVTSCAPGTVILHISLRDLAVDAIVSSDNVVDDIAHACSARTSVHLAQQRVGHQGFIRCTLGEIIRGEAEARARSSGVTVFSPFGLAELDIALAKRVHDLALANGSRNVIANFLAS